MRLLKRLLNRTSEPAPQPFTAPLAPDASFCVVGDIHGSLRLLERLFEMIETEVGQTCPLVFVGDYVDRGEQSAQVLHLLYEMSRQDGREVICLIGNHEDMMLKFLDDPVSSGPRWLRYGGLQTLSSFGVGAISERSSPDHLLAARDALEQAMGDDMIDWLQNLPTTWKSGNVVVVHAGADPSVPIQEQSARVLKWGHPDFQRITRDDGNWIVHGHTIVDAVQANAGRLSIDTGAYATGRLSAVYVDDGVFRTLEAGMF